jgi:hypothetical protein
MARPRDASDYLLAFTLAYPPPHAVDLGEMLTEEFNGIREAFDGEDWPRTDDRPWARVFRTIRDKGLPRWQIEPIGGTTKERDERAAIIIAFARGWLAAYRMMKDSRPE